MPVDIVKMRSDPRFREASYQEQSDYMREAIFRNMAEDGRAQQLTQDELEEAADSAAKTWRPVLREEYDVDLDDEARQRFSTGLGASRPGDDVRYALWLAERGQQGDERSLDEASMWMLKRRLTNSTLIGALATGAQDIGELLTKGDKEWNLGFDGDSVEKLSAYLAVSHGEKGAARASVAKLTAGAAGFLENLGLTMATVGTSAMPGLFTKGAFAAAAKATQTAAPGAAHVAAKFFSHYGIEAIGSAGVDVLRSMPDLIAQGHFEGDSGFWRATAETMGEGIAFDIAANVAADVVRLAVKPMGKIFFGKRLDLTTPHAVDDLQEAVARGADADTIKRQVAAILDGRLGEDVLSTLPREQAEDLVSLAGRVRTMEKARPERFNSDGTLTLVAKAAGYDTAIEGSSYTLSRDGIKRVTLESREDAFAWLRSNQRKFIDEGDLEAPWRGQLDSHTVISLKGTVDPKRLSTDTLVGMSVASRDGALDARTIRTAMTELVERGERSAAGAIGEAATVSTKGPRFRTVSLAEDSFLKRAENMAALVGPDKPLLVPKTLSTTSREKYLEYLTAWGKAKTPAFGNLAAEFAERSAVSPQGLKAAASRLPQGALEQGPDGYTLRYVASDGQVVRKLCPDAEEAGRQLGQALTQEGLLSEQEIIESVYRDTGIIIEQEVSGLGTTRYLAKAPEGKGKPAIIASADKLTGIFEQRPSLWPRLPERLGPELYVLGGGKYELRRTIASGPYGELLRTMNSFGPRQVPDSWRTIEVVDGSRVKFKASPGSTLRASYAVAIDDLGYQTTFQTLSKARKFVSEELKGWDGLRQIADTRGFDLRAGPRGTILISSVDETQHFTAKSLGDAQRILRDAPVSETHKELFESIDKTTDAEITKAAQRALETDDTALTRSADWALKVERDALDRIKVANTFDAVVAPAFSALERIGKRVGRPDIPIRAKQLNASVRARDAQILKSERIIRAITSPGGKMIDRNTSEILGQVLAEGPEHWVESASKLGLQLEPKHLGILNATKSYYERMGTLFGIDSWRYISEYAPKLRAAVADFRERGALDAITKNELLTHTFGPKWRSIPEVRFFAQHSRMDNFLDATRNRTGLVDQLVHYTEQGWNERFLGKHQETLAAYYKDLEKLNLQPAVQQRIRSYYEQILGGASGDWLDNETKSLSLALTSRISEGVQKLKGVFPPQMNALLDRVSENVVTTDLPGKASAMITHATLGFRPFRAVSNMFQLLNTYAVFGDDTFRAAREVTDETVERYFRKGIIQEKVFAQSAKGLGEGSALLEAGLRPQQQSEYLTRIWTANAAEHSFDDAFVRLSNGAIKWDDFVRESRADIVDETTRDTMLRLIKEGQPDGAKVLFQTEVVRNLMFDYAKENHPLAFKGVVGRAFGKFGVFPVGQVDLYRRIAASGPASTRLARSIRMIAGSTIVYNAFRQVGIDYSGFLWNDAFSFSGGPLFQAGQDLMHIASDGPEGQLARRNLARSFLPGIDSDGNPTVPRLIVPGALEINALVKAARLAPNAPYSAAITALGATVSRDWLRGRASSW